MKLFFEKEENALMTGEHEATNSFSYSENGFF